MSRYVNIKFDYSLSVFLKSSLNCGNAITKPIKPNPRTAKSTGVNYPFYNNYKITNLKLEIHGDISNRKSKS